jgi:hypothetical protein
VAGVAYGEGAARAVAVRGGSIVEQWMGSEMRKGSVGRRGEGPIISDMLGRQPEAAHTGGEMGGKAREAGEGPAKWRCWVVEHGQDKGIMHRELWVMRDMRHTREEEDR